MFTWFGPRSAFDKKNAPHDGVLMQLLFSPFKKVLEWLHSFNLMLTPWERARACILSINWFNTNSIKRWTSIYKRSYFGNGNIPLLFFFLSLSACFFLVNIFFYLSKFCCRCNGSNSWTVKKSVCVRPSNHLSTLRHVNVKSCCIQGEWQWRRARSLWPATLRCQPKKQAMPKLVHALICLLLRASVWAYKVTMDA